MDAPVVSRFLSIPLSLVVFLLTLPASNTAVGQLAPQPETPEAFLQRIKPILDHDAFVIRTDAELNEIVIPKIEFHEAKAKDAIDEINKWIVSHNSKPKAFQIPLLRIRHIDLLEHATPASAPGASPVPGVPSPGGKSVSPEDATITLSLSNTNVKEWIRYITSLSGMMIDIEQDAIWLKPLSYGESLLLKRVYIVPEAVFSTKAQAEKLLKPIVPQFTSPDFFWDFNERSHLLTLQFGNPIIEEFEKKYAKELLQHGFRLPSPASK